MFLWPYIIFEGILIPIIPAIGSPKAKYKMPRNPIFFPYRVKEIAPPIKKYKAPGY